MVRLSWQAGGYDRAKSRVYKTEVMADAQRQKSAVAAGSAVSEDSAQTRRTVTIRSTLSLIAVSLQRILDADVIWTIDGAGIVTAAIEVTRNTSTPYLPRFGVRLFLPAEMDRVTYFGLGPQESGSHADCAFVLAEGGPLSLRADALERNLSFQFSRYTQEELTKKAHNFELRESGYSVLCLDFQQSGIGSNSCGPELGPKYRLEQAHFTFRFMLTPVERSAAAPEAEAKSRGPLC